MRRKLTTRLASCWLPINESPTKPVVLEELIKETGR
jgi:hypothetical protein